MYGKTISIALKDKSMHTHRVCSLQPIANKTGGPLNKRGCIAAGLLINLTKDTALRYTTLPGI